MKLKLSFGYIIAFLLLTLVMLELHETVHITIGRIICGGWGSRDFNVWNLCKDCSVHHPNSWLATLAGPLFSFTLMWAGMFLLYSANNNYKAIGFALIFANIPFGRITQAMMGSGDEMIVTRELLKDSLNHNQLVLTCSFILVLIGLPPIIKAYRTLKNKMAWLYIAGFLTLPLVFILTYVLTALNTLLNKGFLNAPWIMGTALLITLHTFIALFLLARFYKRLLPIGQE
ncbi:hypothetical protein [Mucilaginibacter sp. UYCu711]|uniref:hypothetical protein n=1 Tax=Mucilaginibacter sp. UYCu711 TaxID=3156339 RepID=UPI003D22B901